MRKYQFGALKCDETRSAGNLCNGRRRWLNPSHLYGCKEDKIKIPAGYLRGK
jgi:hypothetical protein